MSNRKTNIKNIRRQYKKAKPSELIVSSVVYLIPLQERPAITSIIRNKISHKCSFGMLYDWLLGGEQLVVFSVSNTLNSNYLRIPGIIKFQILSATRES